MPKPLSPQDLENAPQGPSIDELMGIGMRRDVVLYPDPVLRQQCEPVGALSWDQLVQLAGDLLVTMYAAKGRGLAGPQIGAPYRIFVMDPTWKTGVAQPRVVLDAQITPMGDATEVIEEACLSIPGQPVLVTRPASVTMVHFGLTGNLMVSALSGIEARIAQHEADHLDGRLILDLMAPA